MICVLYIHCLRNLHVPITRQSTGLTLLKDTFKRLGLGQLHVHAMDAFFHNQWLISKRGKGLA